MRYLKLSVGFVAGGVCLASVARVQAAAFVTPSFSGQANTTYQEWDGFTSPAGPNVPTHATNNSGVANWIDTTAATDGAFLTGGHVYSFSGTVNPEVDVPTPVISGGVTTLVLQAEVLGNPLDTTKFALSYPGISSAALTPTSVTETDVGTSGSGFGGGDFLYYVEWDNLPPTASYAVTYTPGQSSSSQVSARVDTLTAVPEPASISLAMLGASAFMLRRRRAS